MRLAGAAGDRQLPRAACVFALVAASAVGAPVGLRGGSVEPRLAAAGGTGRHRLNATRRHVCLPIPNGTLWNGTRLLRRSAEGGAAPQVEVEDVDHSGLLRAAAESHVFATLYTTTCPNCIIWLSEGGRLDQVTDMIQTHGLAGKVKVLTVDVGSPTVDNQLLSDTGYHSWFVPALFAVPRGEAPVLYTSTSVDPAYTIFNWLQQTLFMH
mmetsp:Transcript_50613/g.161943  ORF Transcript_50613/g.161943 Transcript_50613/m.161943 type:complete len:210 (+) Transcript_50613:37-666(+)